MGALRPYPLSLSSDAFSFPLPFSPPLSLTLLQSFPLTLPPASEALEKAYADGRRLAALKRARILAEIAEVEEAKNKQKAK